MQGNGMKSELLFTYLNTGKTTKKNYRILFYYQGTFFFLFITFVIMIMLETAENSRSYTSSDFVQIMFDCFKKS